MKRIFKTIFKLLLISIVLIVIYFVVTGWNMYISAVSKISIEDKINEIRSRDNYVKIEDIPDYYWKAVVAIEDKRFFDHGAIDIISTGTAIVVDFINKDFSMGGSTITQQLAKNLYFTQEKKIERKVAELFVANRLEKLYTKEEILEIYMNIIYYGDGYYGIYDASMGYFNKEPKDLTLYESTLIAGIPNAPSIYSLSKNNNYIYKRQDKIIKCMVEVGYLTEEEAKKIMNNESKETVSIYE